jgi:hypothetical protein
LPSFSKIDMSRDMTIPTAKSGIFEHVFVLQDRKRLPARFFAAISGALNTRLS